MPVRLGGPSVGAIWAFESSFEAGRWETVATVSTPPGLKGQHLIGFYSGESVALAMMLGKRWRNLRNARGVRIHEEGPTLGFSLYAGADFVWLRPLDRPPLEGVQDAPEVELPPEFQELVEEPVSPEPTGTAPRP